MSTIAQTRPRTPLGYATFYWNGRNQYAHRVAYKPQFIAYLKANPGWHASADLQRIEWRDHRGKIASAQNDGRRFRELVNEGKVEVEYRKNHAHYKLKDGYGQPKFRYEQLPNGNVREVPVQQVMQESE